jgi:hypothetical protein
MSFRRGDRVAAAGDLGGFLKGKVPAGTVGVVDEVEPGGSGEAHYTVTFTIEQDDLLMPHSTTLTQLGESDLTTA